MTIHSRHVPDGCWRLSIMMGLLILPALGLGSRAGANRPYRPDAESPPGTGATQDSGTRPYLTVAATPALRFRDPPPPPVYDTEPTAAGLGYLDESSLPPAPPVAQERQESSAASPSRTTPQQDRTRRQQTEEEVPAILPDDLKKEVHPEDVIPFFLFPGSGSSGGVVVPVQAPAQAPQPGQIPSSATYRQQ